jgi:hypothetical protein
VKKPIVSKLNIESIIEEEKARQQFVQPPLPQVEAAVAAAARYLDTYLKAQSQF